MFKLAVRYLRDFLIVFFLLLLSASFFWRLTLLKGVFFGEDVTFQMFPQRVYAANLIRSGTFPLWTPDIFCGFPLFAEGQTGVLYPPNVLFLVLPGYVAFNYLIIFHFFLAGAFMYLFTRALNISRFGCLISSLSFMFCWYFALEGTHMSMLNAAIWLPLVFYLVELGLIKNKVFYFPLAGLVVGISFLSGYPQTPFHILMALFFYLFFRGVFLFSKRKDAEGIIKLFLMFIIVVIVGLTISAVQILPTYELKGLSVRQAGLKFEDSVEESLTFRELFLYSLYFFPWKGSNTLPIDLGYVGLFPLILTLIALVLVRGKLVKIFALLALFFFILSLGKYGYLYKLLYYLPGFNLFRIPAKFMLLVWFFLACLSGIGADFVVNLASSLNKKLNRCVLGMGVLFLFSFVLTSFWYYKRSQVFFYWNDFLLFLAKEVRLIPIFIILVICLLMLPREKLGLAKFKFLVITLMVGTLFIPLGPKLPYYSCSSSSEFVEMIKRERNLFRQDLNSIYTVDPCIYLLEPDFIRFLKDEQGTYRILFPVWWINLNLLYNLPNLGGEGALKLKRFQEFREVFVQNRVLYDLVNGKYALIPKEEKIRDKSMELVYDQEIKIYRNKRVFPRAFIVYKKKIVKDKEKLLSILGDEKFNPWEYVFLEEELPPRRQMSDAGGQRTEDRGGKTEEEKVSECQSVRVSDREQRTEDRSQMVHGRQKSGDRRQKTEDRRQKSEAMSNEPSAMSHVPKIVRYSPNEVIIQAKLGKPGFLVLTDTYYPGWEVFIDGKKGKIYRADYLFRAVYLEKGEHKVRFVFNPLTFKVGLLITAFSLLSLVVFLIFPKGREWEVR